MRLLHLGRRARRARALNREGANSHGAVTTKIQLYDRVNGLACASRLMPQRRSFPTPSHVRAVSQYPSQSDRTLIARSGKSETTPLTKGSRR
jgi:hypothetical protein